MKKILILGLALIFSGSILASTFESPPVVDENPIAIVAIDYNDFTELAIVDNAIVNPNITADIVIAIEESYIDDFIIDNQKPVSSANYSEDLIATNDYKVIYLNDNNSETEKIEHIDPGNSDKGNKFESELGIKEFGNAPPKLE